jgi:hypothetical protein
MLCAADVEPESALVWRAGWGWVSRPVEPEVVVEVEADEDAA